MTKNNVFINSLGATIAKASTDLSTNVAKALATNDTAKLQIINALVSQKPLLDGLATTLTSDITYKNRITGPPGSIADASSLASTLKPNTIWCADGDLCSIPVGKKGIDWKFGGSKIYDDKDLHVATDDNLYLDAATVNFTPGATITSPGRLHIFGGDNLYILNKNGAIVGKDWGGNGNLAVQGNLTVGGTMSRPCTDKVTPWNDKGSGNAVFLDRHNVDCGTDFLSRFQLQVSGEQYRYNYRCCKN